MSTPSPALVTQAAVRRLPPLALVLFVLCYVMAGFWGREPWKTIDMGSLGVMLDLVSGRSSWLAPTFLGQTPEAPALLPYWLGAWALALAPTSWDAAWVSRLPFVLLLTLTLASTWKAIELLARSRGAQPVAFAFGGEAKTDDYARVMADAGLLALMACLGLAQASHEVTPMAVQLCLASLLFCGLAGLGSARGWAHLALAVASLLPLGIIFGFIAAPACAWLLERAEALIDRDKLDDRRPTVHQVLERRLHPAEGADDLLHEGVPHDVLVVEVDDADALDLADDLQLLDQPGAHHQRARALDDGGVGRGRVVVLALPFAVPLGAVAGAAPRQPLEPRVIDELVRQQDPSLAVEGELLVEGAHEAAGLAAGLAEAS